MKEYINLVNKIFDEGSLKESSRENMPKTLGISQGVIKMDLSKGFPLLTTKKMYWKKMIHELLWFLKGDTNIKYLVDNDVNFWTDDAYNWYLKFVSKFIEIDYDFMRDDPSTNNVRPFTKDEFIYLIKSNNIPTKGNYTLGDLGKVYGYQWRNRDGIDQLKNLIDGLKNDPFRRNHIIDSWNPVDSNEMAVLPCHAFYQFIVRPISSQKRLDFYYKQSNELLLYNDDLDLNNRLNLKNIPKYYLDLNMYQRSGDVALGIPVNLASMSLLLMIVAKTCNMVEGISTWMGGDIHVYENHIDKLKRQSLRSVYELPKMEINKNLNNLDDILSLAINDFKLINYKSQNAINYELFVGLKK